VIGSRHWRPIYHQLFARGWHVRYDLETGKFDVPPEFRDDNPKALDPKDEDRPSSRHRVGLAVSG